MYYGGKLKNKIKLITGLFDDRYKMITGGGKRRKSRKSKRSKSRSHRKTGGSHKTKLKGHKEDRGHYSARPPEKVQPVKISRKEQLDQLTFSDLRQIAKSKGIPLGGLRRDDLIQELRKYY